jgi:hypothetical protein
MVDFCRWTLAIALSKIEMKLRAKNFMGVVTLCLETFAAFFPLFFSRYLGSFPAVFRLQFERVTHFDTI